MRLLQDYETEYIQDVIEGTKRKNMMINIIADSHYRVYPSTVEYYTAIPEQDYVIQPDNRQKSSLGTNHFWNEF